MSLGVRKSIFCILHTKPYNMAYLLGLRKMHIVRRTLKVVWLKKRPKKSIPQVVETFYFLSSALITRAAKKQLGLTLCVITSIIKPCPRSN
jgi:hypothetical protein